MALCTPCLKTKLKKWRSQNSSTIRWCLCRKDMIVPVCLYWRHVQHHCSLPTAFSDWLLEGLPCVLATNMNFPTQRQLCSLSQMQTDDDSFISSIKCMSLNALLHLLLNINVIALVDYLKQDAYLLKVELWNTFSVVVYPGFLVKHLYRWVTFPNSEGTVRVLEKGKGTSSILSPISISLALN